MFSFHIVSFRSSSSMTIDLVKRMGAFVLLCLVQALVLNQIHLFNCAPHLLYIDLRLGVPGTHPKWAALFWAFLLGITVDTFANTPGVAAASLTAIAAIQPYFVRLFIPADQLDDSLPTMSDMGFVKYVAYAMTLVLLYCMLFFTLEMFCFFNLLQWVECVLGSTLLTLVLVLTLESIQRK